MTDLDASKPRNRVSLHVKGLTETITRQKLIDAFGRFGEVVDVHIPLDHVYKRVLGFAFVEMDSREKAEEAMKELDNKPLDGRDISVAFAAERRKTAEQMRHRSNQIRDNRESSGGGGGGRERGYESYRRGDDRSGGRGQDYGGQDDRGRDDRSRDDYRSSRRPYDSRDNLRGSREDYRPYESFRDVSRGPGDRNRGDNPYSRDDDRHGRGDRWHDSGKGGSAYGDNRGGSAYGDNRGGSAYGDNRGGSESIYGGGGGRYSEILPSPDYATQRRHIRPHYSMPPGDEVRPREINESDVRGVGNKSNSSPS